MSSRPARAGILAADPAPPVLRRAWLRALLEPPDGPAAWLLRLMLLALLYAVVGILSLKLALPPGYASAVWPPSGLTVALLLLWGRGLWPGAWLGSLAVNAYVASSAAGQLTATGLAVAVAIASGSTLQAMVGSSLVRRYVGFPTLLDGGTAVFRFFALAGPVACVIAASVGTLALSFSGALHREDLAYHAFTWWVGDTMGVFLIAPLVVVWALERRHAWRHRLPIVAGSVLASLAIGAVAVQQTNRVEIRRTEAQFREQAIVVKRRLDAATVASAETVQSLADFYEASSLVTEAEFMRFAGGQVARASGVRVLEWLPLVPAAMRSRHEAQMRAAGYPDYRIFESRDGRFVPAAPRARYFPVQYVAPAQRSESSRGFDVGSEPTRLAMLAAAARSGTVVGSAPVDLLQDARLGRIVLLAAPVFDQLQEGDSRLRGYTLALLPIDALMAEVLRPLDLRDLGLRLRDLGADPASAELYRNGTLTAAVLREAYDISLAGRTWRLEVLAGTEYLLAHRSLQAWVTQAGVFLFSGLLGAFLLVLTGRAARVEQLVEERTDELGQTNEELLQQIEDRRAAEERLRLYGAVFENIGEATMILDAEDRIVSVNRAYTRITGLGEPEVVGRVPAMLDPQRQDPEQRREIQAALEAHAVWSGEVWDRHKDGRFYPAWLTVSLVRDTGGVVSHRVAVFADITERKASEERMQMLAQVDGLTGLPNRLRFAECLEQTLESSRRHDRPFGLMFIDIDRFKNINDSLGHSTGDALLREMARRLQDVTRAKDIVARQGGDEFVVLLPEATYEEVAAVAQRALHSLAAPVTAGTHLLTTTGSIGIALYPLDGEDAESLMRNADTAMYVAKNAGRNRAQFFTPDMNERVRDSLQLETELRAALEHDELRLYYQPQIDLRDGHVVGLEALLRWQHPRRGLLNAGDFIQVAEDSGLVEPLGDWALREACRQGRIWQDRGLSAVPLAVNLSVLQLRRGDTVTRVQAALDEARLAPQWLELEVTESMLMQDVEQVTGLLHELRAAGVRLSLDDFGTGYSSLAYLQRFPLSKLKVDRSFVRDINTDQNDAAICKAIIALAHTLGLQVVAEGVETRGQLDFLREHHCDAVQGSVIAWALPPAEVERFLREGARSAVGA